MSIEIWKRRREERKEREEKGNGKEGRRKTKIGMKKKI